ncbi:hypothetical protein L2E82_49975 [Cichorium intybus]|nr:hypothetical protein L2E82_49975 [Cichorium intybus]
MSVSTIHHVSPGLTLLQIIYTETNIGKVPVLETPEGPVFESNAILYPSDRPTILFLDLHQLNMVKSNN